jgi:hypothetical protein
VPFVSVPFVFVYPVFPVPRFETKTFGILFKTERRGNRRRGDEDNVEILVPGISPQPVEFAWVDSYGVVSAHENQTAPELLISCEAL